MVGFLAHAGAGMQDRLIAQLPSTVKAPELPYAATLQREFARWKTDDRFADALKGVEFPDLAAKSTIDLDLNGGGQLPADLVELVQTTRRHHHRPGHRHRGSADVRPADPGRDRRHHFRRRDRNRPARHGATHPDHNPRRDDPQAAQPGRALTTMRATLARMDRSVRSMNAAGASMTTVASPE